MKRPRLEYRVAVVSRLERIAAPAVQRVRSGCGGDGDAVQVVTLEKRGTAADRFLPGREINLVVLAVAVFDRMFEFVERGGLGVQQLPIAVQKPVVDDTVQRHPFRSPVTPNGPPGPRTLPANAHHDHGRSDPPPRHA